MTPRTKTPTTTRDQGFTLVELLVVMVVVGVLAAIAVPVFLNQKNVARDTATKSDVRNFTRLLAENHDGSYPTAAALNASGATFRTSPGVVLTVVRANTTEYCVAATNTLGGPDRSGIGVGIGLRTEIFVASPTSPATAVRSSSSMGCLATGPVDANQGYYDSSGYHAGTIRY